MQARWSVAQILDMAPSAGSRVAARRMASPAPWSEFGTTDTVIWGSCQGSGRAPYQVVVELDGPVFRCSCPSRLEPCKHGLGLLLQWSAGRGTLGQGVAPRGAFAGGGVPDWATGSRVGAPLGDDPEVLDPAEVARRSELRRANAAARDALMTSGIAEFRRWLGDLGRAGLGSARRQPYRYWDAAAARLVDAKLPGLAERVRNAGALVAAGGDWAGPLLAETGRWYAAVRAWDRRPLPEVPADSGRGGPPGIGVQALDADLAADLATYLGITRRREAVIAEGTATGRWAVAGVRQGGDARLRNQRTWLIPSSGSATTNAEPSSEADCGPRSWVLLLDFAAAGAVMATPGVVGSLLDVELARYPGSAPVRALFVNPPNVVGRRGDLRGVATPVRQALDATAEMLAANPWRDRVPLALCSVRVVLGGDEGQWVVDQAGDGLPLDPHSPLWTMLAVTGGHPADVFGELEGDLFYPMTVAVDGHMVDLG